MDRPLKDHIADLEQNIEKLKARQCDITITSGERFQATTDLGLAERALSYFRQAYELEQRVQKISN